MIDVLYGHLVICKKKKKHEEDDNDDLRNQSLSLMSFIESLCTLRITNKNDMSEEKRREPLKRSFVQKKRKEK